MGVCSVQAVVVAVYVREANRRAFTELLERESLERFRAQMLRHYERTGSWDGVAESFDRRPPSRDAMRERRGSGPPPRPGGRPAPTRYGLADGSGIVHISAGRTPEGRYVPEDELEAAVPLEVGEQLAGYILLPTELLPQSAEQQAYLRQLDTGLIIGGLGAVLCALLVGVGVARFSLRPLRELNAATRAVAQGDLQQEVQVSSADEIGQLAQAFNTMSAALAQAEAARQQMTADVAHELRTPITVIAGYLEALADEDLSATPERLRMMHAEAQRLKRLVDDLRTLSLADAGALPMQRAVMSVAPVLDRVAQAFAQQAAAGEIALQVEHEGSDLRIDGDGERLYQVLANLVVNALRHTPSGGVVTVCSRQDAAGIAIEVADTGEGIPEDALPHIFERLYRREGSRHQTEGQSGLGLAIARSIVQAHGGTIMATSTVGKGTCFTLQLPEAKR
ncbi:MAG: ATP-binding protein [Bacteroidota bacterium]